MSFAPTDRVLATLNQDGTRRWIDPRLARGRFLQRRRVVGYALIALFVMLPFVEIGGRPAFVIDLVSQELAWFGLVFRPSEGYVLMLLGLTIAVAVFLATALFGRVWCGWGCPQTVYLELVFRPIERALRGRRGAKWVAFSLVSIVLANVFLAYFVGVDRLQTWVFGSPLDHPIGFGIVVVVAALVLFDFGYFREQMCTVACPYGRLQSVLLDRQSLIIAYDAKRGEPRAMRKKHLPVIQPRGDCVHCNACVIACPTGIDIRDGLQMECIGCAQCIDACDTVMDKLALPRGLVSYTSQDVLAGQPKRLVRVRTIVYPALLVVCATLLALAVATRSSSEISVGRISGPAFVELADGRISAAVRLKIENSADEARYYTVGIADALDATLRGQARWHVLAHHALDLPVYIDVPRASFVEGRRTITLRIADDGGFHRAVVITLLGPQSPPEKSP